MKNKQTQKGQQEQQQQQQQKKSYISDMHQSDKIAHNFDLWFVLHH